MLGKNRLAELQGRLIDLQVDKAMLAAQIKAAKEEIDAAEAAAKPQTGGRRSLLRSRLRKAKQSVDRRQIELRNELVDHEIDASAKSGSWIPSCWPSKWPWMGWRNT